MSQQRGLGPCTVYSDTRCLSSMRAGSLSSLALLPEPQPDGDIDPAGLGQHSDSEPPREASGRG